MIANALSDKERALMDAYWRAANYLSVGQIYLYDNPLLKEPLTGSLHTGQKEVEPTQSKQALLRG